VTTDTGVLIVGEDSGISKSVRALGRRPIMVGGLDEAFAKIKRGCPPVIVINLPGQALDATELYKLSRDAGCVVVMADRLLASAALAGAGENVHILHRPVNAGALHEAIRFGLGVRLNGRGPKPDHSAAALGEQYLTQYAPLLVQSPQMRAIKDIIEQVANTNATVLIRGESGVGKDLVARGIHHASPRRDQPYVKINCAALPGELLESELFGHEKGAFTGAYRKKLGKFEFANTGTLFLDEIGELPLGLQAKMLHVLQDHEFSRVGGRENIHVDARIIASTNRDLEEAMSKGLFREDLFYRLNVVEICVPPLRERKEEIPFLLDYYLEKFQKQYRREAMLSPDIIQLLTEYEWPGNIRELENAIRRLVVLGGVPNAQKEILERLRATQSRQAELAPPAPAAEPAPREEGILRLRDVARRAAREAERKALSEVLERVHWNRAEAARLLQVSYKTLLSKITECGLAPKPRHPRS
jgi:two-component system response regulator AtoC